MSRHANEVNSVIFDRLVEYAADHDIAIPTGDRRIYLDEVEYDALVASKRLAHLRIGRRMAAALLQTANGEVLALGGFDAEVIEMASYMRETELSPGIAVALLADLGLQPTAGPSKVFDIVGAGSKVDASYRGHDLDLVQGLFPRFRVMEIDEAVAGITHFEANLLTVCAAESLNGNGWINESLANEIVRLGEQRIGGFPHMSL